MQKQLKSRKRVADHGEVFTAKREVNAMLDLVKQETERIDSRFLEPACGTGNFLIEILNRKLKVVETRYKNSQSEFEKYFVIAVSSIYGIDILEDNVLETRNNLFDICQNKYKSIFKNNCQKEVLDSIKFILDKNILWGDALSLKTVDENPKPIVFAEWSFVNNAMVKRRDYSLANLLDSQPLEGPNLFSDLGDKAFIPKPVKEFSLTHYLKISKNV